MPTQPAFFARAFRVPAFRFASSVAKRFCFAAFALSVTAALLLPCVPPSAFAQGTGPKLPNPGFRSIGLWNPDIPIRMDIAVWYPSIRIPRDIQLEGWAIRAGQNGVVTPGKYPVILLSHTAAGSRLASHDLAAALARHGFMVIAPTHPGDNMDDTGGLFHAALFADRPEHLLLALETVEKNAVLRGIMDRSRIGVLGVGAGAATALQLAGAVPDLSLLSRHCPRDAAVIGDPFCSNWGKLFHPQMEAEFLTVSAKGLKSLTPGIPKKREPLAGDASLNEIAHSLVVPQTAASAPTALPVDEQEAGEAVVDDAAPQPAPPSEMPQEVPRPELPMETQPVLAVGLLTPGLIGLFPDSALAGVDAPVGILAVVNDLVYPSEESVGRLQKLLPHRPATRILQNAGHFDVQAPCPPVFRESFPMLCGDRSPHAEDSRKIRNDFFVRFFQKTLGPPGPPPLIPTR